MVESVAGSVIGSQVQGVRSSVIALKVEKEQTDSTIKALDDSVQADAAVLLISKSSVTP